MTTIADLVRDVRSRLSGTLTDELNVLDAPYTAGDTSVTLRYDARGLGPGSVISCEENTWAVMAADSAATKSAVVLPSYDGGPDLAKTAGKPVRINPRVTDWAIFTQIRDQIALMCSPTKGLSRLDFWTDIGQLSTTGQYEPPVGVTPSRIRGVYGFDGQRWWTVKQYDWTLGSVRVWDDRWAQYHFIYEAPFAQVTGFAQDVVDDIGLSTSMLDIPVLGATGMLLLGMESRRGNLSSQGDPRRANEVMSGSNLGAGREYLRQRDERIGDEAMRSINVAAIGGLSV